METAILIFIIQWLIITILNFKFVVAYTGISIKDIEKTNDPLLIIAYNLMFLLALMPISQYIIFILFISLLFKDKEFRKQIFKNKNINKKLMMLLIGILFIIPLKAQTHTSGVYKSLTSGVQATFSPDKAGIGLLYNNHNILMSLEFAQPTQRSYELTMAKYGIGYKVYKNDYWDYSLNIIGVYTEIYNFVEKDPYANNKKFYRYSIEMGFIKNIVRDLSCSFHWDMLNRDAKIGFGFNF